MKILVFDDSEINREAAKAQLRDHDLTVVGTYDEAQKLLRPRVDYKKVDEILRNQFNDDEVNLYRFADKAKEDRFFVARMIAVKQVTVYPDFEVVLCDLLVPASEQSQRRDNDFIGQEMPVGIFIALLAAVKGCAKYVAVFTDCDHHSHPASACFDVFNEAENKPTPFTVEGCKVLLSNTRDWICEFDLSDLTKKLEDKEHKSRTDKVRAKNWKELLEYLIK